jgi:DNA polymerase-3 subunit delta
MKLAPAQLSQHLARGLASAYAIAGEEPLLIVESLDALRTAARQAGYLERETLDADKNFDWQRLADLCATGSLFADRRLVEVRLDGSPGEAGAAVLAQLVSTPPADVLLVLVAGRLDARARASKWWSAFEKNGATVYAWPVRSDEFPAWLSARLRAAGFQATPEALALLAQRTEGNLLAASQEIMKLALLHPKGPLDAEAVASAVADSAHVEVFGWLDRLWAGDAVVAARGLQRLREEGEDLLPILGALALDLRKLFAVTLSVSGGRTPSAAAEAAGVFKMRQNAFARAAARARPAQVLQWLRQCAAIDVAFKSGAQPQAWEDLLTLTLTASGAGRSGVATARR